MRRTLVLAALALAAGALVLTLEAPRRRTGRDAVSGPSVLRVRAPDVRAVAVRVADRGFAAARGEHGWTVDGTPAPPPVADAVDALVATLADLRALDAFRSDDLAQFGLDAPGATLVVDLVRERRTLSLGRFDIAGSALYARRDGDPRVFLIGAGVGSAVERVFFQLAQARKGDAT